MDEHPGAPSRTCWPLREPTARLHDLVGSDERAVADALGRPDKHERGRYWLAPGGAVPPHVERDSRGVLRPAAVFGPVPARIPAGQPYEAWTYRNVRGEVWLLYLAAPGQEQPGAMDGRRPRVVVEVTRYPEGAVF